jgi:saccharopepsin
MYSLYDFGDYDSTGAMGNPYVKLLSLVDANDASKDFASVRGAVARTGISYPTTNSESSQSQAASSGSTSIDLSDQTAKVLATLGQYLPALAGIIALNALLVLALLIMAIWYMCGARRRAAAKTREGIVRPRSAIGRQTPRALSPMPMTGANNYSHALAPPGHVYEPVSMALSEDTVLVPPSPGYKYDPESAKGFGRPHSYAASTSRLSQAAYPPRPGSAHFAQGDQPEDAPFEPPALMHRSESDDRPRSMA